MDCGQLVGLKWRSISVAGDRSKSLMNRPKAITCRLVSFELLFLIFARQFHETISKKIRDDYLHALASLGDSNELFIPVSG